MSLPLEQQVCSLPLAQRLKSLGVKQESFFVWAKLSERPEKWRIQTKDRQYEDECSAFTVAELGEMLKNTSHTVRFGTLYGEHGWIGLKVSFVSPDHEELDALTDIFAPTEANARAKMLVYLLENKLITL